MRRPPLSSVPRRLGALLATCVLVATACTAPVQPPVPAAAAQSAPTDETTPLADANTSTPRVDSSDQSNGAPTSAPLQSQVDGPAAEPTSPPAALEAPLPTLVPVPRETITPAGQCDPDRPPPRFGPGTPGGFSAFRVPLPPTPLYNPPGPKRVGLQVGHWLNEQTPTELSRLQGGASGGGKQEWEVNLAIAQSAKDLLEADGYEVDLLPATVPVRYQANVFVAIHADGDTAGALSGYKIARPGFSAIPDVDDRLVQDLYGAYGPATGLPRDDAHISLRMLYYYAFNSRLYCHAVAPGVPQAIVETGFLTSASDRRLLVGDPQVPARGIADGIRAFLQSLS